MQLCDGARSALFLNILTEDNLPHYYRQINAKFGNDDVWGEWNRRWTAEEGRHAIVIRDYLAVTRSIDMRELERARMRQVSMGLVPNPDTIADGIVYVALQELATRISHRNTGKLLNDPQGLAIMSRVAADENLHHLFYRDLVSAALEIDPSGMVAAIERQVRTFEMPGAGIEDFKAHARVIADAGVYDFAVAPRPDPRARRVQALAHRAAAEPQGGGRTGPRASREARGEGRERRHAHEVAPGAPSRRRGLRPAGRARGACGLRTARGRARRSGRVPTPSPVARPPRACAGAVRAAPAPTPGAPRCRRRPRAAPTAPDR